MRGYDILITALLVTFSISLITLLKFGANGELFIASGWGAALLFLHMRIENID